MKIKTKIIQTSKAKILVIGLPDGNELYAESNGCFYTENTNANREEKGEPRNWRIADNRHKLLGRLSKLNEEQFVKIAEQEADGFKNYNPNEKSVTKFCFSTAKESFLSLLEANDVVLENKYGDGKHLETMPDGLRMFLCKEDADTLNEMWQSEQEKVFSNPIIFIEK